MCPFAVIGKWRSLCSIEIINANENNYRARRNIAAKVLKKGQVIGRAATPDASVEQCNSTNSKCSFNLFSAVYLRTYPLQINQHQT